MKFTMKFATRYRTAAMVLLPLFFLFVPLSRSLCQEKAPLTVEWTQGREAAAVAVVPTYRWLNDNKAVLYDRRLPEAERTLELLDPATGTRTRLLDNDKALASLRPLAGDKTPAVLPYPNDFDNAGRRAFYILGGDIYLLDIPSATFSRITNTAEEEKCAGFSPNGEMISFVRSNNLYVYDIRVKTETRLTADGSETVLNGTLSWVYWEEIFGRHDTGYWWSGDSQALAFLRSDESGVSLQHYVDVKPFSPRVLTQRYPKVGEKNPEVRVGIVEVVTGKITMLDFGPHQYEYLIRAQWLPDNRHLSVQTMNRLQTEVDLFFGDRVDGATTFVLKETDRAWVNIMDDLYFLKDGKHFLWPSERDGYLHIYRYTLLGKLVNQVTRGPWSLRSSAGEVAWIRGGVAGIDEERGVVYFTALEKSSLERQLYSVRLDGTAMTRVSREDGTHSIGFSRDARYYFDRFSTASTLPSLRLFDREGKEKLILAAPRPELLSQFDIRYPEFLQIPARDGFPMPAQILRPANLEPGRKYPVIFYSYSGPSAPVVTDSWSRDIFWENLLLQNGYIVARCDNRSATGISKGLETSVLGRLSGEGELNDLVDAARWIKKQEFVDSTRIGIWGWSGGGSATMNCMTRSTEFKAGIAVAGVTDFRFYDTKWAEQVMKTLETNKEGYENNALVKFAKDLHGKLLIVHGTYDDNVHVQNTWAFVDELIKANKRFEMMIYPMRMHGIADPPARIHLYSTMLDFWKRNL
jgi:dipeptidyl-peptidase-4